MAGKHRANYNSASRIIIETHRGGLGTQQKKHLTWLEGVRRGFLEDILFTWTRPERSWRV